MADAGREIADAAVERVLPHRAAAGGRVGLVALQDTGAGLGDVAELGVVRIEVEGAVNALDEEVAEAEHEDAATNVVDFMSLLEKSLKSNKRTPAAAKKAPAKKAAKKTAAKKPAAAKKRKAG